jgi:hypothetical protein
MRPPSARGDGLIVGSGREVVEVDVRDDRLLRDGVSLGRGERSGPEAGDAADDDEQPGEGQPLVEASVRSCGGGNQCAARWVVCVGADGPSLRPYPICVIAAPI